MQKEIDKTLKNSLDGMRKVDKKGDQLILLLEYIHKKNILVNIVMEIK